MLTDVVVLKQMPANRGSYRRQTVEARPAAAPRGTGSKPARPRSGERSYSSWAKCFEHFSFWYSDLFRISIFGFRI
jgi:hypothetical protein